MTFMLASHVPTLTDAFSRYPKLLKTIKDAGFNSIIPLMLLPREALFEIEGVGAASATRIGKVLKQQELGQYEICGRLTSFIDATFGDITQAPIGILQVDIIRNGAASRPSFQPLELISLLEERHPEMTVHDLITYTPSHVRWAIEDQLASGQQIHNLDEDIRHLHGRLRNYDLDLKPEATRPALRVVS